MKRTKHKLLLILTAFALILSNLTYAQFGDGPEAPPPGEEDGPEPPPPAPIDDALPLLIIAGIAVSYYSLRSRKNATKL